MGEIATGTLSAMDGSGDTKVVWSADNPDEIAAARRMFDDLRAKRFIAYSVSKQGERNEVIREFDPHAERIIMAPPMVGG